MNTSKEISREIKKTLYRYRAGILSLEKTKQELAILEILVKNYEATVLEEKINNLQAILADRTMATIETVYGREK